MIAHNYQTPFWCCSLMASMVPHDAVSILEPTPGEGNLVKVLQEKGFRVTAFPDFESVNKSDRFDAVVMNPPWSPATLGYQFLFECMELSTIIIALMPWVTIINSSKRTKEIKSFGLRSVTNLPRSTFPGIRAQPCILYLEKDFKGETTLYFI